VRIREIFMKARAEGRDSLLYTESKELLELWGISTAPCKVARNKEEALRAARSIGFPVVMKVFSPDVIHKTDAGGVLNDLRGEGDVISAYESIENNMEKVRPPIRMEGVVIEKMCSGVEIIVGVTRDPQFGHVILFGMGGTLVELFKDTSFRVIPIESLDAQEMIEEVKGFPLLGEYRGKKGHIESLKDLLLKVSGLTVNYPQIIEMDMNPVFSSPRGSTVADVRILIERQ
jgi:acetate---CoA ligase (ADP-forming) subunit beta